MHSGYFTPIWDEHNCLVRSKLTNDQNFADVIAGEEELERTVVVKQVLDMAVIEHTLQPELRPML